MDQMVTRPHYGQIAGSRFGLILGEITTGFVSCCCVSKILLEYKRPAFHSNRLRDFNYLHSLYCFVFASLPNAESALKELLTHKCIYTVKSQLKVSDKGDPKYLLQKLNFK